jgi:GNAT superfamily N-acetyltransferase
MESNIHVRSLTQADVETALPLFAAYQRFYGVEDPDDDLNRRFFRRFVAPSAQGLLLGAWRENDLVGFACLYFTFSSIHASEIVLLSDLLVREDQRGLGGGRALIEASVDVARERRAHHLEWLTATDNAVAQRLYEGVGAERSAWYGYEIRVEVDRGG